MKKILLVLIILSTVFTGCLQVESTLKVNKDGSGTINEKVLFSKVFVDMIEDFAQAFQDSGSTEEFSIFNEQEIIANAADYGENVEFVSFDTVSNEQWEGYQVVYSFDDVSKIKLSPDPESKMELDDETTADKPEEEYFSFKFIKGDIPQLIIDRPDVDLNEELEVDADSVETDESDEKADEEFLNMLEGMKIDVAVEVAGNVINTNAKYVDGSRITLLQMDFAEMMKNKEVFKEFKKNDPKNIDEMKEYLERMPGIKIETEKPITIKFD